MSIAWRDVVARHDPHGALFEVGKLLIGLYIGKRGLGREETCDL
jgi:hypothetical protein